MTITVIVPTYRRPQDLERCLKALKRQARRADQLLVIVRDTDRETWSFLDTFDYGIPLQTVMVSVPGVIAAMNAGLDAATGEIVALTDDDAAPHPDWLERIESHFLADPHVGAVGGRDFIYVGDHLKPGAKPIVGKIQWFGRLIGDHEFGVGSAREVDILKGVNMSFRRDAIPNLRFDERLQGTGAQVHFELAFSFALKQAGWKLIYDPKVAVDHYHAQRFDADQRDKFNYGAMVNKVHNETLCLLEYLPPHRQIIFLGWSTLIGRRGHPGVLQCLRFLPSEGILSIQKLLASLQGRWQGWQTRNRSLNRGSRQQSVREVNQV